MRKPIMACLAFAFLTSPLHAEEQKAGSAMTSGAVQGAAVGAGGTQGTYSGPDRMKSANKNSDQIRSMLMKSPKPKSNTSGSSQQQGRQ
jgi:hypothetical protein